MATRPRSWSLNDRNRPHRLFGAWYSARLTSRPAQATRMALVLVALFAQTGSIRAEAQQAAPLEALVFDGVTVVDVEHGGLVSNQRVVIVGYRIQAVGDVAATPIPPARG